MKNFPSVIEKLFWHQRLFQEDDLQKTPICWGTIIHGTYFQDDFDEVNEDMIHSDSEEYQNDEERKVQMTKELTINLSLETKGKSNNINNNINYSIEETYESEGDIEWLFIEDEFATNGC